MYNKCKKCIKMVGIVYKVGIVKLLIIKYFCRM